MVSWSVADIGHELTDVASLLQARRYVSPLVPCAGYNSMGSAMVTSICHKLKAMGKQRLTASAAIELYQVVALSQLDDALKTQVTDTIDQCLASDACNSCAILGKRPQSLVHLFNYMSAKDWEQLAAADLSSSSGFWDAMQVVVQRLRRLNCNTIKEDTKKWTTGLIVNLVVDKVGQLPPYPTIYKLSQDLCQAHASSQVRANAGLPSPATYPPYPTELGASFLQLAYDDKDPPVSKSMPKLAQLVQFHIPVRNTSKLMQPSGAPSSHPMACGSNMQALSPLLELLQQMNKRVPEQALLQMTPLKRSKSSLALEMGSMSCVVAPALQKEQVAAAPTMLAVPDQLPTALAFQPRLRLPAFSGHPVRPHQPAKVEPSAAPSMSLEEYETAAFEALKQKKIRSKGVEEESTAATTFKKPAGAKNTHLEGHILGCAKCRGSFAGCTQCRKPDFKGVRIYGRDAYEKHVQQKQHHMAAAAKKSNKKSELCR